LSYAIFTPRIRGRTNVVIAHCLSSLALAAGCGGDDLGDCDHAAAEEVVFSQQGLVATKGQALMHDSCGNGTFCHSSAAKRQDRYGVDDELNFDMLPVPNGWPNVVDLRDRIWEVVVDGDMPPGESGKKVRGDGEWMFDYRRPDGAAKLAPLSTREGKAALRNWLACGAPLVSQTQLPQWARSHSGGAAPDGNFETIFSEILKPSCAVAGCHNAAAAGSLRMLDVCSAFDALMQSGPCGRPRVHAGDAQSLLVIKISGPVDCGGPMPPTGALPVGDVMAIRAWVLAGAMPPESCN
jgi:hypothetical protein